MRGGQYLRFFYFYYDITEINTLMNKEREERDEGEEAVEIKNYMKEKRVHAACNSSKLEDSFGGYFMIMRI